MFMKQSDLFWELGHDFVREVMARSEKKQLAKGEILFFEGDAATYFYTLIKGRIRLLTGSSGPAEFILNHTGEAFGWSALVGRECYSATAESLSPVSVVRVPRKDFEEICLAYPMDGLMFMRRLAGLIGQRLIRSYDLMGASVGVDGCMVYGTGQVQEMVAEE